MQNRSADTILVVGGNGYVGSHICEEAILNGFNVVSISRSGQQPNWTVGSKKHDWASRVHWSKGDALKPDTIAPYIENNNVAGIVSCVGAFHYKQDWMEKVNGDTNVNVCHLAKKYNIKRFVFISASIPGSWHPIRFFASGYVRGKEKAEKCVNETYNDGNGVSLRCGMVSGTRYVFGGKIPLPLAPLGMFFLLYY